MTITSTPVYWCKCGNARWPHIRTIGHDRGNVDQYNINSVDYCCDEMKEAMEENVVLFDHTDGTVIIQNCRPYPEGPAYTDMTIKHCPFCSTLIISLKK